MINISTQQFTSGIKMKQVSKLGDDQELKCWPKEVENKYATLDS